jgi:NADH pyrophosphatase NudC (nudix superfamily)
MSQRHLVWLSRDAARRLNRRLETESVFLRLDDDDGGGTALFAAPTAASSLDATVVDPKDAAAEMGATFSNMRKAIITVGWDTAHIVSQGWSLLRWHRKNSFCACCGVRSERNVSGSRRQCPGCGAVHFPSPAPVGIVLIAATDHSKVLLIRQPQYPPGMFSCVAGFVDVGETLEEAAAAVRSSGGG